ncbi:MAG: nucleotide sugar dehydrogenase [Polyangiales bacterium]
MSDLTSAAALLAERIENRKATVAVIGLGYVGLPLLLSFVEKGFASLGLDIDADKLQRLRAGHSYLTHVPATRIEAAAATGRWHLDTDFAQLEQADAILICVPTPLTPQRDPDLSHVQQTARAVAAHARTGQLLVLESTTYPGTTEELICPLLAAQGLKIGHDVFVAYSPEREDPGNTSYHTGNIPKVVGGVDVAATRLAAQLYAQVVAQVVPVRDARVAEATKLTENIFRAVNIALVNELKMVFDPMGIDIWEVLDAAATKPFGFRRFDPGPGWGGHCIPVDPFYLSWKAREYGVSAKFIELAGEVNVAMPYYVLGKLQSALNRRGQPMQGARILLLGLAYKAGVGDTRQSPALELMRRLLAAGAHVDYHDPFVPEVPPTRAWPELTGRRSVPLDREQLHTADAVLLVTAHPDVDYAAVQSHARLIVDTRGIIARDCATLVRA